MKIRIVGDIHGKVPGYFNVVKGSKRSVQIGDFGFSDDYHRRNKLINKHRLNPDNHLFFGGNHDDYDNLPEFHLGDYGTLPWNEDVFFIRGAKSIDRESRFEGVNWWREEELAYGEMKAALREYEQARPRVLLTHEGPPQATKKMFPSKDVFNTSTGQLLSAIFRGQKPDIWIFGHWHRDVSKEIEGTKFFCLDELSFLDLSYEDSTDTYKVQNI